jgi:hypothetical protein
MLLDDLGVPPQAKPCHASGEAEVSGSGGTKHPFLWAPGDSNPEPADEESGPKVLVREEYGN